MKKILPADYPSLRECVIASLQINGPMGLQALYESLPYYKRDYICGALLTIPHIRNRGVIELVSDVPGGFQGKIGDHR